MDPNVSGRANSLVNELTLRCVGSSSSASLSTRPLDGVEQRRSALSVALTARLLEIPLDLLSTQPVKRRPAPGALAFDSPVRAVARRGVVALTAKQGVPVNVAWHSHPLWRIRVPPRNESLSPMWQRCFPGPQFTSAPWESSSTTPRWPGLYYRRRVGSARLSSKNLTTANCPSAAFCKGVPSGPGRVDHPGCP